MYSLFDGHTSHTFSNVRRNRDYSPPKLVAQRILLDGWIFSKQRIHIDGKLFRYFVCIKFLVKKIIHNQLIISS